MGIFDKIKSQVQGKAKSKDLSDSAEQRINEKTGNKYTDHVDQGQQQLEDRMGIDDDPNR